MAQARQKTRAKRTERNGARARREAAQKASQERKGSRKVIIILEHIKPQLGVPTYSKHSLAASSVLLHTSLDVLSSRDAGRRCQLLPHMHFSLLAEANQSRLDYRRYQRNWLGSSFAVPGCDRVLQNGDDDERGRRQSGVSRYLVEFGLSAIPLGVTSCRIPQKMRSSVPIPSKIPGQHFAIDTSRHLDPKSWVKYCDKISTPKKISLVIISPNFEASPIT